MLNRFLYKSYRFFYAFSLWRQKRFTPSGIIVLLVIGAAGIFGIDTSRTMIYQVFSFLFALLTLALIWSLIFRGRFKADRKLPPFASVDEELIYHIEFQNMTSGKQAGLFFRETLNDPRPTFEALLITKEPDEEKRNIWDRKTKYFRWLWLIGKGKRAKVKEQPLPVLSPNETVKVRSELIPVQRGYLHLNGLTIARPDPFGLFKSLIEISKPQKLLVLPKRYPLPPYELPGNRKYHQGGVALASSVGNSDEFISLRDYRPGDPMRQIHWKSWAKVGELIIKEYQDEFYVRHALILDTFLDTAFSELFEEAVSVASSFACSVQSQESLLDLMFVGDQAYCFSSGRGMSNLDKMLEILACVNICSNKPFSSLDPLVFNHAELLSGAVCILLAWDKERKAFIRRLRALDIPLLVIVVGDDKVTSQLDPGPMKDNPDNFIQLKTGNIEEGLSKI